MLLGVLASRREIYATTDAACLAIETKTVKIGGKNVAVSLYFGVNRVAVGKPGAVKSAGLNRYQGVGYVLGKYWNIYGPRVVKDNSCDMFNFLTGEAPITFRAQYWTIVPAEDKPQIFKIHKLEPFPKPRIECNE